MTTRRLFMLGACVGALFACDNIPAPPNGVLAISQVFLPAPAVVVGDSLRDSTGRAAPLAIVAFGVGGDKDTITKFAPSFVVLGRGAHLIAGNYVIGDSALTTPLQVVGTVGTLQTAPASLNVTARPDSIGSGLLVPVAPIMFNLLDSTSSANLSVFLTASVVNISILPISGVPSVIVHYSIAHQPPGLNGQATGVLIVSGGAPGTVDTTDASGNANSQIRLRPVALASPSAVDSFVVLVSAQYAGTPLRGSPTRFVVPVQPPSSTSSSRAH